MAASLPPEKESDVERGTVQIYKLEQEHFQSKAVLPLRLCPWVLCGGEKQGVVGWTREKISVCQPSGKQEIMMV